MKGIRNITLIYNQIIVNWENYGENGNMWMKSGCEQKKQSKSEKMKMHTCEWNVAVNNNNKKVLIFLLWWFEVHEFQTSVPIEKCTNSSVPIKKVILLHPTNNTFNNIPACRCEACESQWWGWWRLLKLRTSPLLCDVIRSWAPELMAAHPTSPRLCCVICWLKCRKSVQLR